MKKPKQYAPQKSKGSSSFKIPRLYEQPEWQEYSRKFLRINDKCYACGSRSNATDHVIPFKGDRELFWKEDNLIPLCEKCHNTVTANFDKFNPPKTQEKLEWINSMRTITGTTLRVKVVTIDYKWKRKDENKNIM